MATFGAGFAAGHWVEGRKRDHVLAVLSTAAMSFASVLALREVSSEWPVGLLPYVGASLLRAEQVASLCLVGNLFGWGTRNSRVDPTPESGVRAGA